MTPPDTPPNSSPLYARDIPLPPPLPPNRGEGNQGRTVQGEVSKSVDQVDKNSEDVSDIRASTVNIAEIKRALENQFSKRLSQERVQPFEKASDLVTVTSSSTTTPDDSLNFVVVSTPQSQRNKNTSTITINSNLPDTSNSLASNISQVTVVTTHPPVIIDNSHCVPRTSSTSPSNSANEVIIISNETNKTHLESSDEEFCPSLDSLEYPPPNEFRDKPLNAKKLDESEVMITDSSYVINDSGLDVSEDNSRLLDTSHVSVVKIDEEKVQVKDSTSYLSDKSADNYRGSTSDLSNTSSGKSGSTKSDYGDEIRGTSIILDGCHSDIHEHKHKLNGQIIHSVSREDIYKRSLNGKSYSDSFESAMSDRSHSDCGSVRSTDSHRRPISGASKSIEQSDVESISIASHESRGSNEKDKERLSEMDENDEVVVLRKPPKSKSESLAIQNRKTRKRTRKFVIDGVLITTTTSKVIYGDEENYNLNDPHTDRKQELRELKYLQKQEQKQFQDLATKENLALEQQDRKFEQERQSLERTYENDLEMLSRQQRLQIERAEAHQDSDLRAASKKIRAEQERELKLFRDGLKQELRLLKCEIDMLPKERRKMEFKVRKDKMDVDHLEREKAFLEKLNENHEMSLRRLSDAHREKIALMERQFLQQKQQLTRTREAAPLGNRGEAHSR
ncbi:hypothetical protein NQ318_021026 [Aromia moschata]|uniref:Uncharacterized protein n=1 Tax=Aromia moschata TaxID=1265417 RepID=A0AAV8YP56_9CUCU|nr:hypothetical protein NQ318_021026 [Aromia moschata]